MGLTSRYVIGCMLLLIAPASGRFGSLRAEPRHLTDSQASIPLPPSSPLFRGFAIGDVDGDGVADLIAVDVNIFRSEKHLYRVNVRSSARRSSSFNIESEVSRGFQIAVLDVDHDRDLDILITTELSQKIVGVWINDGTGAFTQADGSHYEKFIRHPGDVFLESPQCFREQTIAFGCATAKWAAPASEVTLPVP